MKRVILCVTNDLENDQRVHRTATTLHEAGLEVLVCGRKIAQSSEFTRIYKTKRFRLPFNKSWLFYAVYNIRSFWFLIFTKCNFIFANDMDTLPACWLAARICRKTLIFDSHELFSEVPELQNRKKIKKIWSRLEDFLIPRIDYGITVCDPIANIYKEKYNIDFRIIRNVPLKKVIDKNIQREKNLVLYQGAINKGRGLELLIESLPYYPEAKLVIAGRGDMENEIKTLITTLKLSDRITFLGHVAYDKLHTITSTATVGVSIEEDMGLNYRFALPNKLFDYIQAGVPVVVSNLPVMSKIVANFEIGITLLNRTPQALAQTLMLVAHQREEGYYSENLKIAAETLHWDNEKQKLLSIFADLN